MVITGSFSLSSHLSEKFIPLFPVQNIPSPCRHLSIQSYTRLNYNEIRFLKPLTLKPDIFWQSLIVSPYLSCLDMLQSYGPLCFTLVNLVGKTNPVQPSYTVYYNAHLYHDSNNGIDHQCFLVRQDVILSCNYQVRQECQSHQEREEPKTCKHQDTDMYCKVFSSCKVNHVVLHTSSFLDRKK